MSHPRYPASGHPFLESLLVGTGLALPFAGAVIGLTLYLREHPEPVRPAIVPSVRVDAMPLPDPDRLAAWELGQALDCIACQERCCPAGAWGSP